MPTSLIAFVFVLTITGLVTLAMWGYQTLSDAGRTARLEAYLSGTAHKIADAVRKQLPA